MPSVAVIGASTSRVKYGNKAVRAYSDTGWTVYPVHPTEREVEGIPAFAHVTDIKQPIDRVVMYVPPAVGMQVIEDIATAQPRELFFNPGSESKELVARARELGLHPILACAIVDIGKQPRDYT